MRVLVTFAAHLVAALVCVVAVLGPLGYAIDGKRGLSWAVSGAAVWTFVFALTALGLRRSVLAWAIAGGLICGSAWSTGYTLGELLVAQAYRRYGYGWALIFGGFGGLGAGLLAGAAMHFLADAPIRRAVRLGAYAAAISWGGLCAGFLPVRVQVGSGALAAGWAAAGVVGGLAAMPIGLALGRLLSPVVVFFEELGPYLAEMARPLAAFAAGFLTLTVVCGGLYGAFWRLHPESFRNLPPSPSLWDFVEFSLMTATTGNTSVEPVSAPVRVLKSVEVILGTGWLIVVFGALSVHLAPRLEQIARRRSGTNDPRPSRIALPSRSEVNSTTAED